MNETERVVYVDNNATTKVAPEVFDEMRPYFCDLYGNPSSMHTFGGQVGGRVAEAREKVAAILNCDPVEIVFTSCGTESDNFAIKGIFEAFPEKKHFITTRVEHPAVLNLGEWLAKRGYEVTFLGVDQYGMLNLDELRNSIRDDTALVSIMWANNETGTIFPIPDIARIVKDEGVLFHVDAVQAIGKLPVDLQKVPIDLLALSGHKLHAPKGIGALYIRKGTKIRPQMIGGHQERGRRGGTENTPSIIGLGKACELAMRDMEDEVTRVKAMRDRLEEFVLNEITMTRLNGHPTERLPNTLSVSFEYIEGEAILLDLDRLGICASSGSACTSGSLEPSHVLRAMGVPFTCAHGSVRFSLSRYTTDKEIDYIIEQLPAVIGRLRTMSPYTPKVG
jgi:cysteine desulfurase